MTLKRPNFVFFIPDQYRGDCVGHADNSVARTPNLDSLLASGGGVSFSRAFCQNPVCTPSRCSFLTSWYPHVRGHRSMQFLLQLDEPCLLRDLKEAGYYVWWGGKNDAVAGTQGIRSCCHERHRAESPHADLHEDQSWRGVGPEGAPDYSFHAGRLEKHAGEDEYLDADWCHVQGAIDFIETRGNTKEPFCLYLSLQFPHPPYGVEEPYFSAVSPEEVPEPIPAGEGKPRLAELIRQRQGLGNWTGEEWRRLKATYLGQCARVDAQFGRLMEALRKADLYDTTAVFFFSDHGDYTGDYGLVEKAQNLFEDALVRVPLVIKPPASFPTKPGIRHELVELVDIAPSIYEMADITPSHHLFGRSLGALLAGEPGGRDAVFCEGGIREGEPIEPVCGQRENLYWPRVSWSKEDSSAYGRAIMCRTATRKYVLRIDEPCELYDLERDPSETINVAGDPAYSNDVAALRERLLQFLWEPTDVVPRRPDPRDAPWEG